MARERYHIQVGNNTYSLEADGSEVFEDGKPLPLEAHALGRGRYSVLLDGASVRLTVEQRGPNMLAVRSVHGRRELRWMDRRSLMLASLGLANGTDDGRLDVLAPMPGLVRQVLVTPGQRVESGESLLILEAMKMENELKARTAGTVELVHTAVGDSVVKNELLIEIES